MKFWKNWLLAVSIGMIPFGLALAFFGQSEFFDWLYNREIREGIFGGQPPTAQFRLYQDLIYGVLGSVVAGWGLMMAMIFHHQFDHRPPWLRNAVVLGLSLWMIPDTTISLQSGAWNNATVNALLYLALCLPFIIHWRKFGHQD